MFRFAAAASGAPYAVTQTSLGTDIHNPEYDMLGRAGLRDGKRIAKHKYRFTEDPFFGAGSQVLIPAAKVDVAVMCVQQVGEEGTVRVNGQYYSDPEVARAADITIVMAEEIVPEEYLRRNADQNTIASFEVDHILECPVRRAPDRHVRPLRRGRRLPQGLLRQDPHPGRFRRLCQGVDPSARIT